MYNLGFIAHLVLNLYAIFKWSLSFEIFHFSPDIFDFVSKRSLSLAILILSEIPKIFILAN